MGLQTAHPRPGPSTILRSWRSPPGRTRGGSWATECPRARVVASSDPRRALYRDGASLTTGPRIAAPTTLSRGAVRRRSGTSGIRHAGGRVTVKAVTTA
jgi:hypothetical protein